MLKVTEDKYSKFIEHQDWTSRLLFGDGAADTLVSAARYDQLDYFVLGTDGEGADWLIVWNGGLRSTVVAACKNGEAGQVATDALRPPALFMDGPAIFTFALDVVPRLLQAVLDKSGWSAESVDWYVYHQANAFMLNLLEVLRRCNALED